MGRSFCLYKLKNYVQCQELHNFIDKKNVPLSELFFKKDKGEFYVQKIWN